MVTKKLFENSSKLQTKQQFAQESDRNRIYQHLIDSLKWLLYQNRILGLITFNCTNKKLSPSQLRKFLNIIAIILYVLSKILAVYSIVTNSLNLNAKVRDFMQLIVQSAYIVTVWIWSIINCENFIKILWKLIDFDVKLLENGDIIDYNQQKKNVQIQALIRYCLIALSIIILVIMVAIQLNHSDIVSESLSYFTILLNSAVCHQCIELAKMIRLRYSILNGNLEKIITYFQTRRINFIEIDDIKCSTNVNNANDANNANTKIMHRPYSQQLCDLCYICTMHHQLTKLVKLFNQTFGVILLLMFGVSFVSTVISLFYFSGSLQAIEINWFRSVVPLLSSWTYALDTIYICNTCYTTIEEANKSGELIHKIETDDPELRDEIEMFSLQIVNEQVEFNAAGFFSIDYTLLFSIIGGVTTYIIILIQLATTVVQE